MGFVVGVMVGLLGFIVVGFVVGVLEGLLGFVVLGFIVGVTVGVVVGTLVGVSVAITGPTSNLSRNSHVITARLMFAMCSRCLTLAGGD